MTEIQSTIVWERGAAQFIDGKYSRAHSWSFDGGAVVPASSSPHIVPLPFSIESAVDPEEAFVASLSSCHMLWFLSIAAKRGLRVNFYRDVAVGEMGHNEHNKLVISLVRLSCGDCPRFLAASFLPTVTVGPHQHPMSAC
jgi:organic hydroperoxide reductase OsmC/OhrA